MNPSYSDIKKRLGEPLWFDVGGIPRYEPFHPSMCCVYAEYVALIRITCQACGAEFIVASAVSKSNLYFLIYNPKAIIELPTPTSIGDFHYGDPPNHDCMGDTMNSEPREILEFWRRDLDQASTRGWVRDPEHEGPIREDWVEEEKGENERV